MVALTYDVRTVRIPVPRLVLGAGRARLARARRIRPVATTTHWEQVERHAAERRREDHRAAGLALRSGTGC